MSFLNARFFKKPPAIFLMLMGLVTSVSMLVIERVWPEAGHSIHAAMLNINFSESLLEGMLSFLLFAGSLHVNFAQLRASGLSIISFATVGTMLSTFAIGLALWLIAPVFGIALPFLQALLFGCLISPTDPIAVLGILRNAGIKRQVEIKIIGESPFNDAVAVVLFITVLTLSGKNAANVGVREISLLFFQEVLGGVVIGLLIGFVGYCLMRAIDHFQTEILLSLAMVMGGYTLCSALHFSGPLAMVLAGLITGNVGKRDAMSATTQDYLGKFWEVLDEVLNALLFVMVGFQVIQIDYAPGTLMLSVVVFVILVGIRYLSLYAPATLFMFKRHLEAREIAAMTWGGLRGGISVALALSLPVGTPYRNAIVTIAYVVVALSITIQGFSIGYFIQRWNLAES
ncbi:MAG: sodium:proton antiporter [Turneriella sp.]|nr:sodium:proton antiporter [Turneriella sp.]